MYVCGGGGGGWQTWRLPSDIHSTHVILRYVGKFTWRGCHYDDSSSQESIPFVCVESDTCVGDTLPEDPESSNLSCQKEWIDCR